MSRHAKRPVSKKVAFLNEQLRRKRESRSLSKRFLIVCEDTKSSPHYFGQLRVFLELSASSVSVQGSHDKTQSLQVVQQAKLLRDRTIEVGDEPYDRVWCVAVIVDPDKVP